MIPRDANEVINLTNELLLNITSESSKRIVQTMFIAKMF